MIVVEKDLDKITYIKNHFRQISHYYYNKKMRGTILMDGEEIDFASMQDGEQQRRDIAYNLALADCLSGLLWSFERFNYVSEHQFNMATDLITMYEMILTSSMENLKDDRLELDNRSIRNLYNKHWKNRHIIQQLFKPSIIKAVAEKLNPNINIDINGNTKTLSFNKETEQYIKNAKIEEFYDKIYHDNFKLETKLDVVRPKAMQ